MKVINIEGDNNELFLEYVNSEVNVLKTLRHRNLISYFHKT